MTTRKELESRPDWVLTVRRTRRNARERFDCLMRARAGYYWQTPNYKGLFPYGATSTYNAAFMRDAMRRGFLKLERGTLPEVSTA